jgi:hypothetical protein
LTHLETGLWDAIEKHFKARQSPALMWEAYCSLLLDYVGPRETQQSAARLSFAKYKQREVQSVRDYTEASTHLVAQLPEDYPQVELAITYLTGLKPSIRAYLPVHQILCTFNEAADMALCIESNAELLGTGPAFADGPARCLEDDRSRSASPRKQEGSSLQGGRERDGEADRQQEGGHRSRRKDQSRVRLEERVQPALPQATPAPPPAAGTLAPPLQRQPARYASSLPYPPLPKKADGSPDWEKVLCHGCGKYGHTRRICEGGGVSPSRPQPASVPATARSEKDSAQQGYRPPCCARTQDHLRWWNEETTSGLPPP